jgi:hypothetical protein
MPVGTYTEQARTRVRAEREAFDETIRPHSVADVDETEPLLGTIRGEFRDALPVALAPATAASFTLELPVDHPVLATAATLDATCRACQRSVRDSLVRGA